jgi:hypothetical protein
MFILRIICIIILVLVYYHFLNHHAYIIHFLFIFQLTLMTINLFFSIINHPYLNNSTINSNYFQSNFSITLIKRLISHKMIIWILPNNDSIYSTIPNDKYYNYPMLVSPSMIPY